MTVDSGASDTVIPPHLSKRRAPIHTPKVGTEYEDPKGEVVHNFWEGRASMRITGRSEGKLYIAFQVFGDTTSRFGR